MKTFNEDVQGLLDPRGDLCTNSDLRQHDADRALSVFCSEDSNTERINRNNTAMIMIKKHRIRRFAPTALAILSRSNRR